MNWERSVTVEVLYYFSVLSHILRIWTTYSNQKLQIYQKSQFLIYLYIIFIKNRFKFIDSTITVLPGIILKQRKFIQPIRSNDTKIPSLFPVVWDTWSVYDCTITSWLLVGRYTLVEDDTWQIWLLVWMQLNFYYRDFSSLHWKFYRVCIVYQIEL